MKARNRLVGAALFAASSLLLSGCSLDEILAVHVPGKVLEEDLSSSSLANVLATGVIAEVECSWNQYVAGSAHHSDEYVPTSGNLTMRNWGQRKIYASDAGYSQGTCGGWGYPMFTPLHTARFQAEDVASDGCPNSRPRTFPTSLRSRRPCCDLGCLSRWWRWARVSAAWPSTAGARIDTRPGPGRGRATLQ